MRFVLGVDYDLGEFHRRFRRDPPGRAADPPYARASGRGAGSGPGRRWPAARGRAADRGRARDPDRAPHRRPLGPADRRGARGPARRAGARRRSPAAPRPSWPSMDLAPSRAAALRRVAGRGRRAVAATSTRAGSDRRLLAMPQIGPWTVQCLGLFGRGEMDSLPAGDLGYIKLVGRLAGSGRRATRRRGGGVLRAVRAVPGPGRLADAGRAAPARRPGPAAASGRLSEPCRAARVRAWTDVRSSDWTMCR